jgi:hypothetical protein
VLFEHAWAARLAYTVREAGGRLLAHGILTREALSQAGAEVRVLAEAEAVMEVADAVRSVGLLDALAYASDEATAAESAASLPSALVELIEGPNTLCLRISWEGPGGCGERLRKFHAGIGVEICGGWRLRQRCARPVLRRQ